MNKIIKILNKENKEVNCDILIEFEYDKNKYIVYTDNTINEKGEYNLYKGMIDGNKICDPIDIDVNEIFDKLIIDYKNKVLRGEI